MATRVLAGWDAGVALYLVLTYRVMANASVARIRQRAAIVDEGAAALLILTPAAALASLIAVVIELGHAPSLSQIALAISSMNFMAKGVMTASAVMTYGKFRTIE